MLGRLVPVSIAVASIPAFVAALASAHTIELTAYTLRDGSVRDALVAAAKRGAHVAVRLERDPLDDTAGTLHAANNDTVARLRAAGASASLTAPGEPVLHMKAAVADGVAWMDDRNWAGSGGEIVLRDDDADDVAAIASAVAGGTGSDHHLATTKSGALRLEGDVIANAGAAPLRVETESFGPGQIYNAILHRAQAGQPVQLIVAGREATAGDYHAAHELSLLHRLAALGVEIRVGDEHSGRGDVNEKFAIANGDAWVGSANATFAQKAMGAQREWGIATRQPAIIDRLGNEFDQNWASAIPLARVVQ